MTRITNTSVDMDMSVGIIFLYTGVWWCVCGVFSAYVKDSTWILLVFGLLVTFTGLYLETSVCFPSNSIIQTPKGNKYMSDLQIGDYILGHQNGKDTYVKIKGWLHKVDNQECEMLEITTDNNNKLKMSEKHILPRNTKDNYIFAEELKVGDTLFLNDNKKTKVKSIKLYKTNGFYAPYCSEGLIYVDGVLVHIFAEIKNPDKYLPMYNNLFNFYENTFETKITDNYIHPVARMSSVLLPFL